MHAANELKGIAHLRRIIQILNISSFGSCSVTDEVVRRVDIFQV